MSENKDIVAAKRAIDREVEALEMMKNELDDNLSKVLNLMQKTKGRVIVTGMGKSGHIGPYRAQNCGDACLNRYAFVFCASG